MTNTSTVMKCVQCGANMEQVGAQGQTVLFHCPYCGYNATADIAANSNGDYLVKKTELLCRVTKGISEWNTTQWDYLRKDLVDFMSRYEDARADMLLNMGVLACVTHGFHYITEKNYKECKTIYKLTEKLYKVTLKNLKNNVDPKIVEQAEEYKQDRNLYKKCRNDYRNTKMAWKAVFFVFKKLLLK